MEDNYGTLRFFDNKMDQAITIGGLDVKSIDIYTNDDGLMSSIIIVYLPKAQTYTQSSTSNGYQGYFKAAVTDFIALSRQFTQKYGQYNQHVVVVGKGKEVFRYLLPADIGEDDLYRFAETTFEDEHDYTIWFDWKNIRLSLCLAHDVWGYKYNIRLYYRSSTNYLPEDTEIFDMSTLKSAAPVSIGF